MHVKEFWKNNKSETYTRSFKEEIMYILNICEYWNLKIIFHD
jgi:hypothetical protein